MFANNYKAALELNVNDEIKSAAPSALLPKFEYLTRFRKEDESGLSTKMVSQGG
jgi:hypothetical protein